MDGGLEVTGGVVLGGDVVTGGVVLGGDVVTGGVAPGGDVVTGGVVLGGDVAGALELPDGFVGAVGDVPVCWLPPPHPASAKLNSKELRHKR
jgi:hypothetical protein